jgi:hypothetical protein
LNFEAIDGVCEPTTSCEKRGLGFESNSLCGEGCVHQNEGTSHCSDECDNEAHYEADDSGVYEQTMRKSKSEYK